MIILLALGTAAFVTTITGFLISTVTADMMRDKAWLPAAAFGLLGVSNYAVAVLCAFAFGGLL